MSPQKQNPLETATATVIGRSRGGLSHKNTTGLKPMGFRFGRFYQIDASHRVNASDLRCLPQF
jgi:hypothetical protein